MNIIRNTAAIAAALVVAPPIFAHHSEAGMDMESVIAFEGTVNRFSWRNPHVYVIVETEKSGEPVEWELQLGPINILTRRGWTRDSLSPGDQVAIRAIPMADGRPYGILRSIDKEGFALAAWTQTPAVTATATSLAGKWTAQRPGAGPGAGPAPPPAPRPESDGAPPCTSGFDCFFLANLVLTDTAKAAAESYDPLSADNPEATCVGRPTPSALVSARGYLLEFDLSDAEEKILIRSEWFNEERTIWMDGRTHPDGSETLVTGHSIGHWEGDTLVVDTRNFDDHRSPYQIGVPSGSQKHVVERYRLNDDGTSMQAEFTLEDPEFLAESFTNRKNLYFSPHMEMLTGACDTENAGRWLN